MPLYFGHTTPQVQEKCLDEGDKLTLEKAIQIGQNHETSHASLKVIGDDEDAKVHAIRPYSQQKSREALRKGKVSLPQRAVKQNPGAQPKLQLVPAVSVATQAHTESALPPTENGIRYHKRGHFAKVCRTKVKPSRPRKLHAVDAWSSDEEYAYLVNAVTDRDAKLGR